MTHLATAVVLGPAVTEEVAKPGIGQVMVFMADHGADSTHALTTHHLTRVAFKPAQ